MGDRRPGLHGNYSPDRGYFRMVEASGQSRAGGPSRIVLRGDSMGGGGLMRLRSVLLSAMAKFWWWLRQVTGDAAYENYLGLASRRSRTAPHHANGCEQHGSGSHG